MQYVVWGWLAALIVFIIVEIATVNLTTIWFAAGSLIALILNLLKAPLVAQIIAFFVVSIAFIIFIRPVLERALKKSHVKTNVDGLIGMKIKVTEKVDNINGTGAAFCNGSEWTIKSEDDNRTIDEGEIVEIVAVSGVKLIVK